MSTIFGLTSNDIRPQPGFTASQNENGGWTGTHTFAIRRTAWNDQFIRSRLKKGTPITDLDPSLSTFFSFMTIVGTTVLSDEGDFTMVTAQIAGAATAQYQTDPTNLNADALPTYRLSCSLQDAPLAQHPKWATFSSIEQQALSEMISGGLVFDEPSNGVGTRDERSFWLESNTDGDPFTLVSADSIAFAKLIAAGETTYQRPAITWTESTQGNEGLNSSQLNKIGKISNPRGNPPTPTGGRDWMLTSAFDEETGGLHRTELEWTMSEAGGFNPTLYEE